MGDAGPELVHRDVGGQRVAGLVPHAVALVDDRDQVARAGRHDRVGRDHAVAAREDRVETDAGRHGRERRRAGHVLGVERRRGALGLPLDPSVLLPGHPGVVVEQRFEFAFALASLSSLRNRTWSAGGSRRRSTVETWYFVAVHGMRDRLVRNELDPRSAHQVGGVVAGRNARRSGGAGGPEGGDLRRLPGVELRLGLRRRGTVAPDPAADGDAVGRQPRPGRRGLRAREALAGRQVLASLRHGPGRVACTVSASRPEVVAPEGSAAGQVPPSDVTDAGTGGRAGAGGSSAPAGRAGRITSDAAISSASASDRPTGRKEGVRWLRIGDSPRVSVVIRVSLASAAVLAVTR